MWLSTYISEAKQNWRKSLEMTIAYILVMKPHGKEQQPIAVQMPLALKQVTTRHIIKTSAIWLHQPLPVLANLARRHT
jgi:hypothetical protein